MAIMQLTDNSIPIARRGVPSFAKTAVLLFVSLLVSACTEVPKLQTSPHFQMIKWPLLRAYLRGFGYQGHDVGNYWQSANGDTLYIPDYDFLKGYSLYLISADHEAPQHVMLPPSTNPLKRNWVDPTGKVNNLPKFAYDENDRSTHTVIDDQSGFFFQRTKDHMVHVGKMDSATDWLFTVPETDRFDADQVCVCAAIIYLLDHRAMNSVPASKFSDKNCWAFAPDPKNPAKYVKVDEISIPGVVRTVDPFSPRFVCDGYSLAPFWGHPFLYDVSKRKITTSLPEGNELILFLNGDWLTPRLTRDPAP
jgi:hypothetical protein